MAVAIRGARANDSSEWIFKQLARLIASCVLLDCVQTGRKGENPMGAPYPYMY